MAIEFGIGLYSPKVAARIARIRPRQFQAWARANLVHPSSQIWLKRGEGVYTYNDLLLIRLIVRLKEKGFRPKVIKEALDTIKMIYGGDPHAWLKVVFYVIGSRLIVAGLPDKPDWSPIAVSRGPQKLAVVFFPDLVRDLEKELVPPDQFPHVEVDPEVLGGAPVIKGTRIPTRAVALASQSGGDALEAYPELTSEEIENAVAYEEFLQAA